MRGRRRAFMVGAGFAVAAVAGCTTPEPQPARLAGGVVSMSGSGINVAFGGSGDNLSVVGQYGGGSPFDSQVRSVTVSTPGQNGATDTVVLTASGPGTLADELLGGYPIDGPNPDITVTATVALGSAGDDRVARCSTDPALNFGQDVDLTGFVTVNAAIDSPPPLPVGSPTTTELTRHKATVDLGGTCFLLPDAVHPTAEALTTAFDFTVYLTP